MVGFPTIKVGGFSIQNIPTLHFKGHLFDFIKKLAYQMNSRNYTKSGRSVAEIQALRGNKAVMKKYNVSKQSCRNPNCRILCKGFVNVLTHLLKKSQECLHFYTQANILEELEQNAKLERRFRKKIENHTLLKSYLEKSKNDFKTTVHYELGMKINMVKKSWHGASVENGNTTMKFLHPDNRDKVIGLFYCKNEEETIALRTFLEHASVIIGVTNRIGKIHVQEFREYVHSAHMYWIDNFKKFVHIKNSLHWILGHIAEDMPLQKFQKTAWKIG